MHHLQLHHPPLCLCAALLLPQLSLSPAQLSFGVW
jgi:hypothetical protein